MRNKVKELKVYLKKVSKLTSGYLDFIVIEPPTIKGEDHSKLYIPIIIAENKKTRPEMIYVPLLDILK